MNIDRRKACISMTFASLASLFADAQAAQPDRAANAELDMNVSKVFRFSEMKVSNHANGSWSRAVMHGTLPTGEFVEVHETMLPPGQMPHPPHRHRNTEFVLIRQGKLEFLNDGHAEAATVGDVIYTASNRLHGMTSVGDEPALYFVVSISHGQM